MEVSGDLQDPAALPQITTPVPTEFVFTASLESFEEEKKILAFPGIRTLDGRVHS